jgi:hypothetical protein
MTDEDRQIGLAGKVLVDKIDAQLLEVQKQGQVVGFVVALTMEGRFHRRNERSMVCSQVTSSAGPATASCIWRGGGSRCGCGRIGGCSPSD